MPIAVSCPECDKPYKVKDEFAGKKFKCKGCQASIMVPDQSVEDFSLDELEAELPPVKQQVTTAKKKKKKKAKNQGNQSNIVLPVIFGIVLLGLIGLGGFFAIQQMSKNASANNQYQINGVQKKKTFWQSVFVPQFKRVQIADSDFSIDIPALGEFEKKTGQGGSSYSLEYIEGKDLTLVIFIPDFKIDFDVEKTPLIMLGLNSAGQNDLNRAFQQASMASMRNGKTPPFSFHNPSLTYDRLLEMFCVKLKAENRVPNVGKFFEVHVVFTPKGIIGFGLAVDDETKKNQVLNKIRNSLTCKTKLEYTGTFEEFLAKNNMPNPFDRLKPPPKPGFYTTP